MAFTFPTSNATIESFAAALYGYGLGSSTLSSVQSDIISSGLGTGNGLNNTLNNYYSASFGAVPTATVAASIVKNVGLGTDANAIAYVTGQLNAAAPNARGAAVVGILNAFSALTADKTYGAAATAWTNTVSNLVTYAQTTQGDATLDIASKAGAASQTAAASAGQIYTLLSGVDNFTGTSGNDTFTAADGNFGALDSLNGNGGTDTLNITNTTNAFTTPTGVSISGVANVNLNSTKAVTYDTTTGYTGLGSLGVSVSSPTAASTITAGSATSTNVSIASPGGNTTTVYGGLNDVVTVTDPSSGANPDAIVVGSTTKGAAGTITVNSSQGGDTNNTTGGTITTYGGTSVTITANETEATTNKTATNGAIGINGGSKTTTVTVTQTAPVTANAGASASTAHSNLVAATYGVGVGAVTVSDSNYTTASATPSITTVSLTNYAASTVYSSALTTLNLTGQGADTTGTAIAAGGVTVTAGLATPTVTTLNVTTSGYVGAISDSSSTYTTLNLIGAGATTIAGITGGNMTTVNISGSGLIATGALPATVSAINVSGAAAFSGTLPGVMTGFNGTGSTLGSSVTLNAATQSFTGGAGSDTVSIAADALKPISGGSGTNILKLTATGSTYKAANSGVNITGFQTLDSKPSDGTTTAIDLANFSANTFTSLIAEGSTSSTTFNNVVAGTPLTIKSYKSSTAYDDRSGSVYYNTSDYAGMSDSVTVTLTGAAAGSVSAHAITKVGTGTQGTTTDTLSLLDAAGNGLGTVNIVTDGTVTGSVTTINTLTDTFMSTLNITGTSNLTIGALTLTLPSLTISDNDTSSGTSSQITDLTDAHLTNINYSGSHAFAIPTVHVTGGVSSDATSFTVTNANTGTTGVLTLGSTNAIALSAASKITLKGSVAATITNAATPTSGVVTVSGSTDNSTVSYTGSGSGINQNVTLGNGGNSTTAQVVTTGTGTDTITVGTGYNTITPGNGGDTITFAAGHTGGADKVVFATAASPMSAANDAIVNGATVMNSATGFPVIYGLIAGDKIDTGFTTMALASPNAINTNTSGKYDFVDGNYNQSTGVFTKSVTGTDTLLQWYDATASHQDNVIIVGFAMSSPTIATGVITLG